jgi:hypothetical protein
VQRYGPDFRPAFRLVAVCPDGFPYYPFHKAKLDRLLARRPFVQLLRTRLANHVERAGEQTMVRDCRLVPSASVCAGTTARRPLH